jgi:hypothetical protein
MTHGIVNNLLQRYRQSDIMVNTFMSRLIYSISPRLKRILKNCPAKRYNRLQSNRQSDGTMSNVIEKSVIPLKHARCGHSWEYGRNNPYYATCPYCRNQVNIRKNAIGSEPMLLQGLTHPISSTTGANNPNG